MEILEYSLVFLVSSIFISGSAAAYANFSAMQADLRLRATFAEVSTLAGEALDTGSSRGTVDLPGAVIACRDGTLSVSSGPTVMEQSIPGSCDFEVRLSSGSHQVAFSGSYSGLSLSGS